ncbi:MAG: hypothetical protein M1839_002549 [Geoglossum umbratile]|nr:MAG: hypothetical protein M1839_002549 [Geoglossum umbratile]
MARTGQYTNRRRRFGVIRISWFHAVTFCLLTSLAAAAQPQPAELIPWSWAVKPADTTDFHCPAPKSTLGTFAVVNVITSVLAVLFGNRKVVSALTRGLFGKEDSKAWRYLWLVSFGLQLGANAIVALVIQRTAGFGSTFAVGDLVLFYATRPRLSWLILGFLDAHPETNRDNKPSLWSSAARQAVIAEVILQFIAMYYAGRTVHFASTHGYYKLHADYGFQHGGAARMMYGGALLYLLTIVFNIPYVFVVVTTLSGTPSSDRTRLFFEFFTGTSSFTSWLGSWLFWAGYVRLAGNLYCPPKLSIQGVIWTALSVLGIATGTGV